ncbi:DUF4236 domain-containing protein [uncultured Maritimibacter sp.]|jgi:predicted  nucleic acid-binding Zn-ribbon protein|uniref:DUF4236 domain-containing protein n=1 Tax=uncultured Maritimibacter sp. TaxID=991866 RepID=UPI000AE02684|nr:DUF4236 domain-containing protein [uncultured Maritimibacter sp.]
MRYRKSIKIMPGVRVNLSKSGISTSVGGRGATVNVSKRAIRSTLSVPGTGLSWSSTSGWTESQRSLQTDEIEHLRIAASKAIEAVSKEAEKANAIGIRIDRAIDALNGGRGLTNSKAQTFEKRVLTEEQKLSELEGKVREHGLFLDAIEVRLRAMKFGMFAGRRKRHRDNVAEAVATSSRGARDIGSQLADVHRALSDKLSEVQDKLDALEKGA